VSTAISSDASDNQLRVLAPAIDNLSVIEEEDRTPTSFCRVRSFDRDLMQAALKRAGQATAQRFKKSRKVQLLHPIDEKQDDLSDSDTESVELIGKSNVRIYKDTIK
jgi:hypothetical protein